MFDLILWKLTWWLVGEMHCKLSGRAASVGKVWKVLSLMLTDGGVRKEIEVCQSCRTYEDRDDANYPHPHCPCISCMSRTIRVNVVSSSNGSTSRSRPGVSVMEIDINLIGWKGERWSKSRAFNRINDFTWYCIQLLHRISLDNKKKTWQLIFLSSTRQLGSCFFGSLPTFHGKGCNFNLGILGLDMTNWCLSKSCWNSPAEARAYCESPWFYGSYQNERTQAGHIFPSEIPTICSKTKSTSRSAFCQKDAKKNMP